MKLNKIQKTMLDEEFVNEFDETKTQLAHTVTQTQGTLNVALYENLIPNKNTVSDKKHWDWTPAIKQAIEDAFNNVVRGINMEIKFPEGVFRVKDKVLSNVNFTTASKRGLKLSGVSGHSSVLLLETNNQESWFYNNGENNPKFEYITFRDLGFTSDNWQFGNGFKLWSSGVEKQFRFFNCIFGDTASNAIGESNGGFQTLFETSGTGNADLCKFHSCFISGIYKTIFHLNNPQSVVFETFGTDMATFGDVIQIGANGGGSMHFFGGACELHNRSGGDTTPRYVLNLLEGVSHGPGNCEFNFHSVRYELQGNQKALVNAPSQNGIAQVLFDACNIGTVNTTTRDAVILGARKKVTFRDCVLHENLLYRLRNTYAEASSPESGALLVFDSCRVGLATSPLFGRITIESVVGRAIARNCVARGASSLGRTVAQDFDLGLFRNALPREGSAIKKILPIKPEWLGYPLNGGTEYTVDLPPDAMITSIYIHKPAKGTSVSSYQLHIGNDAKTVTYGSSVAGELRHEHKIDLNNLRIFNEMKLRLWATGAGSETNHNGIAFIEYI